MNLLFFQKAFLANDSEQGPPGWGRKSQGIWALLKVQLALLPLNLESGKRVSAGSLRGSERKSPGDKRLNLGPLRR